MLTEHDVATTGQVAGLSSAEASRRLASSGPNTVADLPTPAWRRLAKRFWGPLPWMLEGTAILTLLLGRGMEAAIIATLLVVNSLIVRPSPRPDRWRTGALTALGVGLALGVVAESFLDLALARGVLHLPPAQVQTLMFTMLVFTGQATVYLVRERGRLWASRPATLLLAATAGDVVATAVLAVSGIAMAPVALGPVLLVLGIAAAGMLALDPWKVWILRRTRR